MDYSPCSEREIWPILGNFIPKLERPHPFNLFYMYCAPFGPQDWWAVTNAKLLIAFLCEEPN